MTSINVNFENLTEDERAELERLVDKSNEPFLQGFRPKHNEKYFYINGRGEVDFSYNNNSTYDHMCYSIGNCFKTEEEAKFEVEKLKINAQLKRMAKAWNTCEIDWEDGEKPKYHISYCGRVTWCVSYCIKFNDVYFLDEEACKRAIELVGEERLEKYYFEVK